MPKNSTSLYSHYFESSPKFKPPPQLVKYTHAFFFPTIITKYSNNIMRSEQFVDVVKTTLDMGSDTSATDVEEDVSSDSSMMDASSLSSTSWGETDLVEPHVGYKKVLVTGGAGFIGSHVAEYLLERGDDVVIVDEM